MGIEKIKDLEPKLIQWITLEKEVMEEVINRVLKGVLTSDDWDNYFIGMVKKHGNELMMIQLRAFIKIQESYKELLDLNINTLNKMKESPISTITDNEWETENGEKNE